MFRAGHHNVTFPRGIERFEYTISDVGFRFSDLKRCRKGRIIGWGRRFCLRGGTVTSVWHRTVIWIHDLVLMYGWRSSNTASFSSMPFSCESLSDTAAFLHCPLVILPNIVQSRIFYSHEVLLGRQHAREWMQRMQHAWIRYWYGSSQRLVCPGLPSPVLRLSESAAVWSLEILDSIVWEDHFVTRNSTDF
jgi:hypothetical protein